MFVSGLIYSETLKDLIKSSSTVEIAVAFLGEGAENLIPGGVKARIICNLESGATNPSVVRKLQAQAGVEIRTLSNLHAKVLIGDQSILVGSANLSANGLGLEGKETAFWEEAGLLISDPTERQRAHEWFCSLWAQANEVDAVIDAAIVSWRKRRRTRMGSSSRGLCNHLLQDPHFAKDRPLYLIAYREAKSALALDAQDQWVQESGMPESIIDSYEDWEDLPEDSYLIDFMWPINGKVKAFGIYTTGPSKIIKTFRHEHGVEGKIQIVFKQDQYDGMKVVKRELEAFREKIESALKKELKRKKDRFVVPLYDFLKQANLVS